MGKMTSELLKPQKFYDDRGCLYAYSDFDIDALNIKRMFLIEVANFRGWHGHKNENNWFKVSCGSLKILLLKPDDWQNPSHNIKPEEHILTMEKREILFIPAGYVSAIKPLRENSVLHVFSDKTLNESLNDDFRFNSSMWYYDTFM